MNIILDWKILIGNFQSNSCWSWTFPNGFQDGSRYSQVYLIYILGWIVQAVFQISFIDDSRSWEDSFPTYVCLNFVTGWRRRPSGAIKRIAEGISTTSCAKLVITEDKLHPPRSTSHTYSFPFQIQTPVIEGWFYWKCKC